MDKGGGRETTGQALTVVQATDGSSWGQQAAAEAGEVVGFSGILRVDCEEAAYSGMWGIREEWRPKKSWVLEWSGTQQAELTDSLGVRVKDRYLAAPGF